MCWCRARRRSRKWATLRNEHGHLRLSALGGNFGTFDVVSRGEWTATFPLSAVSTNGRMPGNSTSTSLPRPGASPTPPVASVIWNNVLLNAAQLDADGSPERLRRASRATPWVSPIPCRCASSVSQARQTAPRPSGLSGQRAAQQLPELGRRRTRDGTFIGLLPLLAGNPR
jgi:hypothetical protein